MFPKVISSYLIHAHFFKDGIHGFILGLFAGFKRFLFNISYYYVTILVEKVSMKVTTANMSNGIENAIFFLNFLSVTLGFHQQYEIPYIH